MTRRIGGRWTWGRRGRDAVGGTDAQLRLALAPACAWHEQQGIAPPGAAPCDRDAQVIVTDDAGPRRGARGEAGRDSRRRAACCAAHGLLLAAEWRRTVAKGRNTAVRIAWMPAAPRWLTPPAVLARVRRYASPRRAA